MSLQSMLKADHLTIWRQCACMSQNFSTQTIDEEPKNDNNHQLQLHVSRPTNVCVTPPPGSARGQDHKSVSLPDLARVSIGPTSSRLNTGRSGSSRNDLASKEIIGGQILWSFLSTPPQGNMFGYLSFMATVSSH